jgi:hypothetical protein
MERFLQQHQAQILGVLSGLDRVRFRGTLPSLNNPRSLNSFLHIYHILFKDFSGFVQRCSAELEAHARALASQAGRPYRYLASPSLSKEAVAREIAQADGITEGLICVLACVERCASYSLRGDWKKRPFPAVRATRQCLHFYFYYLDREFGLMHVRLQSWLPFTLSVCLNGREYLARRMAQEGIAFTQLDNCFTQIADLPRAQQLLDELHTRDWAAFLQALATRVNPLLDQRYGLDTRGYYWTVDQSEHATDVMFRDRAALQMLYPKLLAHAMQHFACADVLRFFGRALTPKLGEVTSDCRRRVEGTRVKHRCEENTLKMYDKQASVLRIETTVNDPRRFSVLREAIRRGQPVLTWRPMRKGVVDLARRAERCRQVNARYLEALAVVGQPQPVAQTLDPVSRRRTRDGRPYRALRPVTPEDAALFRAVMDGVFRVHGFCNRDLRERLLPTRNAGQRRQAAGRITRWLRLLRGHGLIAKRSRSHRYRVTVTGEHVMSTALKLRELDLNQAA